MNAVRWFVILTLSMWVFWGVVIGIADSMLRRRYRQQLQTRAWREKVDAMRRLQDRDGDA